MKRSVYFLTFVVMTVILSFTAIGQVKQVFLFKDAVTDKPLENVKLNIIGENEVVSNSKGIAIVESNKNKIGDDYDIKEVLKDGYVFLGKNWKTGAYFSVFSKDTLEYILCSQTEYRKICNLYYNAMMKDIYNGVKYNYNYWTTTLIKEEPDELAYISQLFFSKILLYKSLDAANKMQMIVADIMQIDYNIRKEYEDLIAKGEIRKVIDILESKIDENDLSEKNLMLVAYYLQILNLDPDYLYSFDITPYYKLLATKRPAANMDYLLSVIDSKEYDIQEEYPKIKDKIQTKYYNHIAEFYYNLELAIKENDNDDKENIVKCYKKFSDNISTLNNEKDNIYDYMLVSLYGIIASFYDNMDDTANTIKYRYKMLDLLDKVILSNDNIETIYDNINVVRSVDRGTPLIEDSVYEIKISNIIKQKIEENYKIDSLLLITRIPYINMNIANQLIDEEEETKEEYKIRNNYIQSLVKDIKPDCNEYYSVQEMRLKYNEMINAIDYDTMYKNWQELNAIYNYIDSLYPDMFIGHQYYANSYFLEYVQRYGQEQDVINIIENNDELLKRLKYYNEFDANYFLSQNNNTMAEYYYNIGQYDKALHYYDKQEEYLQEVVRQDSDFYIELCKLYFQKGDAYVYNNQIEKGIAYYSKVNDLELSITEEYKEEYNAKKILATYFIAEAYRLKKDYKNAIKYFDKTEKGFKELIKTDESFYNIALAEMYYLRSEVWKALDKKKKSFQDLQLSYYFYRMMDIQTPIPKYYVTVQKDIMQAYLEKNDINNYVKTKLNFINTLKEYSYVEPKYLYDYTEQCYSFAYELENLGLYEDAITYFQETVDYMDTIQYLGGEIDYMNYMDSYFEIANGYASLNYYDTAILYYNKCLELNKAIKDTNESQYYKNSTSINLNIAYSYGQMTDIDTIYNSDEIKIDSLFIKYQTDAINDFAHLDMTNDVQMQYEYAKSKTKLATFKMKYKSMAEAEKLLQESNDIALQFNVNPYKQYCADVIMYNHLLLGVIYEDSDKQEAKKEYYKALNIYDNLTKEDKKTVEQYCATISSYIIDILVYDENMQDEKEIKRLQKNIEKYQKLKSK